MNYYIYIGAVVIIILIFIFLKKKNHKYWGKQPVSRKILKNEGIITNIIPQPLKSKKGYYVKFLNSQYYSDIGIFLSHNYIKNYNYNTELITWLLNYPYMVERNRIAIYNDNRIVSFICAKPMNINLKGKPVGLHYIDLLAVHNDRRKKNLAPTIISYAASLCWTLNYTSYIFKIERKPLPFKYICKSKYAFINIKTSMLEPFKLPKQYSLDIIAGDDFQNAFTFFINSQKKYKLGFFPNMEQFQYYFKPVNKINISYILKLDNNIIGLCNMVLNTVKIFGKYEYVAEVTTIELTPQVSINISDFMKLIIERLKSENNNITYINIINIAQNRIIIDRLGFSYGMDVYFHMYNYHIHNILQNYEIGYNPV